MSTGVTEYAAGFKYIRTERGITATRIFNYDSTSTASGPDIPLPGAPLVLPDPIVLSAINALDGSINYVTGLICREVEMTPLAGHPDKYVWTATYNNEPVDKSVFTLNSQEIAPTAVENLPINLEYSGEYTSIVPSINNGWTWTGDGSPVLQPVPKRVNQSTIRITRYVPNTAYFIFQSNIRYTAGKVNQNFSPFGVGALGGGINCWLFVGASTEIFRNFQDDQWWRAELEFVYRDPDGLDDHGWQKVLRLDGSWDIPKDSTASKLYDEADFKYLFLNEDNPSIPPFVP